MEEGTHEKIKELLERGVEHIYPNKEFLEKRLKSGEKLTVYLGADPTAPTLHIGHTVTLQKLRLFQELGHKVILLIGDFTATIGDPTDKSATRVRLSPQEVKKNEKLYKKQASRFLKFSGENPAVVKHNSSWHKKMRFADVLDLASNFTVQQMLERDMFEKRVKEGKPIYIHEFLYPLLQAKDSVEMGVDGEVGGTDQTFNMLAGRTLMKQTSGKEKFVLTLRLLEDQSGAKMGKTTGNMIALSDSANEMVGKVMSWTDGMVVPGFELCTALPMEEIRKIQERLAAGENPRDVKRELAQAIATQYHGQAAAKKAIKNFTETFSKGNVPSAVPHVAVQKGEDLYSVLSRAELVNSRMALRRLVEAGAVNEAGGEKISSMEFIFTREMTLKIGKRRFLRVALQ